LNTVRRVAKNTLSLASAEVITKLLAFVLIIFIARHLQDVGFGKYSFVLAFTSFFAIIADIGFSTLTIREVARDKALAGKYLGNIFLVKFVLSLIAFILLVIVINLMHYPYDTTLAVYIAGAYVVVTSFNRFFISIFRAFEKMEYEALVRVVEKVIVFSLVMYLIYLGYGLIEIVFAFLISSIFSFVFSCLIVLKKFAKPKFEVDLSFLKNATKEALPFGLTAIFVTIYFQIDTVMLSIMQGDAVVGWYNAAYTIIFGLMLIPAAFVGSVFPLMSKYYKSSEESLKRTYKIGFKCLLIAALPITVIGFMFADEIISFLYNSGYAPSVNAFQVLIFIIPIIFLTFFFGHTLQSINKQRVVAYVTASNALFNVALNLILIPTYSYIGAAVATVFTEGLGFVLMFYFISKFSIKISIFKDVIKPLFAGLILIFFIHYFNHIGWILVNSLGTILYIIIVYLTKTFSKEDVGLLKTMLGG
jgi:O-antigen/teichoic acid export membrane protein